MDKKDELRLIETHEMQISKHFAVNFNKTLILKNGNIAMVTSIDYYSKSVILIINTTTWSREAVLYSKEYSLQCFAEFENGNLVTGFDMCVWDISEPKN